MDRSLTTAPVAAFPVNSNFRSKSVEHDVTLTSFMADLSYSRLPNSYMIGEIVAREGTASLVSIPALI